MSFGEIIGNSGFVIKPFVKTVLSADFTSYPSPCVILTPPFAVVQGWLRLESERSLLKILINGIESTECFEVSKVGKKVDFSLKNTAYTQSITLTFEASKTQTVF